MLIIFYSHEKKQPTQPIPNGDLGGLRGDACPPCLVAFAAGCFVARMKVAANRFVIECIEFLKADGTGRIVHVHDEGKK